MFGQQQNGGRCMYRLCIMLHPAWSRDGRQNTVRNETQIQKYSADLTYFVFVYIIYYTNNSYLSKIFSHIFFWDFRAHGHFARIPSDSEVKTTAHSCYRSCNVTSGRLEVLRKHMVICHNINRIISLVYLDKESDAICSPLINIMDWSKWRPVLFVTSLNTSANVSLPSVFQLLV